MASGTISDDVTIGIDIGTTSVKALAVDADGTIVARSRVPHDVHAPTADIFEHDARQAWVDGPRAALAELGVTDAAGIGIAAMTPSFTAVDADGMPLTPGLLYGDHRGRVDEEPDLLNSREVRAMLEWTVRAAPGAHGYWPAPAVAAAALGGTPVVDYGVGFALSPLWNGEWDHEQLASLGITGEQMPQVVDIDAPVGKIGTAVQVAGVADAWADATVAGANHPGDALVICGTTLIVWSALAEPVEVPGLWTLPHPLGELQMLAGASNAGAMFLNWVRRALTPGCGSATEPGRVPIWVPYLRGERSPVHDASRRGSLHDVDLGHDAGALLRAAYEASGFIARRIIESAGTPHNRIVASGGGAYDPDWMQTLADCTGLPVDVVAVPEGAALGAAWHARVGAGLDELGDATRWVRFGGHVEPDPAWVEPCTERYERWRALAG